jgi:8-oxo-dGTP diphosphatase
MPATSNSSSNSPSNPSSNTALIPTLNPPLSTKLPLTQVAVGIVHNAQGQVLYAQRPAGKPYAGWWEFPGGKLDRGESLAAALARELKEELGITIHDCHAWLTQRFVYPHAHVNLQFCHVRHFSGTPQGLENQAFVWGSIAAPPLPFLPAALPVLKVLQLPQMLRFTNAAAMGFDAWQAALSRVAQGLVIVHEPSAADAQAHAVLTACLAWKAHTPAQRTVLVASCHPQAWWGLADGVHLSEQAMLNASARPSYEWVTASVTTPEALAAAKHLGCNCVTVGPVLPRAQNSAPALGWAALGELLAGTEIAAYASGGMAEHYLPFAFAAGSAGVAAKSGAWI